MQGLGSYPQIAGFAGCGMRNLPRLAAARVRGAAGVVKWPAECNQGLRETAGPPLIRTARRDPPYCCFMPRKSSPSTRPTPQCPDCGGPVMRVLRTANDKRRWDADEWRRYRCRDTMCNWQGLLPRKRRGQRAAGPGATPGRAVRRGLRALPWLLLAAGVGAGGLLALGTMLQH